MAREPLRDIAWKMVGIRAPGLPRAELRSMSGWIWLLAGLVFFFMEAMTPGGFYLFFFGVGAVVVGLWDIVGRQTGFAAQGLVLQSLVFVGISIVCTLVFRKPLLQRFQQATPTNNVDSLVGEMAKALVEIPSNAIGTAELRGASWNALNIGDQPIPLAARCRVERVDGLTLHVRG
jgi:inner membrane protein